MKVLVFYIGTDRYGLRLAAIDRVLPVAELKAVPLVPDYVAGLLDLHGEPVPVIDLSRLAGVVPQQVWVDTRIVLAPYRLADGSLASVGMLAEHVSGVEEVATGELREPGIRGAAFMGQVASSAQGMLQLVEIDQLLTAEVRALLFPPGVAA
jgi:chemotaxis-related protein WspB